MLPCLKPLSLTALAVLAIAIGWKLLVPAVQADASFAPSPRSADAIAQAAANNQRVAVSRSAAVRLAPQALHAGPLHIGTPTLPALPAQGTPVIDLLKAHVDGGRTPAPAIACRLAADLAHCRAKAAPTAHSISRAGNTVVAANDPDNPMCAGVTHAMLADAYRLQTIAAAGGSHKQQRWLAMRPQIDGDNFLANLPQWQDYQRRAEAYFRQSLSARRGEDLDALLLVHAPGHLHATRPPYQIDDQQTFLALYEVARATGRSVPNNVELAAETMRVSLPAEDLLALEDRILELADGWTDMPSKNESIASLQPDASSLCD